MIDVGPLLAIDFDVDEQLEIDAKYEVYLSRQAADVESYRRDEEMCIRDSVSWARRFSCEACGDVDVGAVDMGAP